MTPAEELHALARDLANAYATLAELKWTPERPSDERVMRTQNGSRSPSPDNDRVFNIEYELERKDDNGVPGGLKEVAFEALGYTLAPPHSTRTCRVGYLDDECTPAILCAHIACRATEIVEHFPAAGDLADLMAEQLAYLTHQINHHHGTGKKLTTMPADTLATGYGTAADLAPLVSAAIGRHIDRKQITYWGRSGRITAYTQPDGTTQYRIDQTITAAREYTDKRHGPTTA